MYFLTNYCLFMSKVENNNILILYISHFMFVAINSSLKITIFDINATFYGTETRANQAK